MKELTLHYTAPLLRQAVRFYFMRTMKGSFDWRYVVAIFILIIALVMGISAHASGWQTGFTAAILLIAILPPSLVYLAHYYYTLARFRQMRVPEGILSYTESDITFRSELGLATLPWSSIRAVWQHETFWLLLLSKSQFVTLPLVDIDDETREVILSKIKEQKLGY